MRVLEPLLVAGLAGQEVHPNSPDLSDAAVDGNS
jgi:hypothetical protein